jgi:hypothetical protein
MSSLGRYGLEAFGVVGSDDLNDKLVQAIKIHYNDQEKGIIALKVILDDLFQKAEAISDGKSLGFRMFTTVCSDKQNRDGLTKDVFRILRDKGWHYSLILTDDNLLPT